MFVAAVIVLAFVSSLSVEASYICFSCHNTTSSGDVYCSSKEALDKSNKDSVENCTAHPRVFGCYTQVTFNATTKDVVKFDRDCATDTVCSNSTLPYRCDFASGTYTCLTCCTGDYCNDEKDLKLITPTTMTTTPTTMTTTPTTMTTTPTMTTPTTITTTSAGTEPRKSGYFLGVMVIVHFLFIN